MGDRLCAPRPLGLLLVVLVAQAALVACSPAGSPGPTPGPTPPGVSIERPEEAAELVLQQDPRFGDLEPKDPDMSRQCCWYEAVAIDGGYHVVIRIGWGDCMAGCIHQRTWTYAVTRDGQVGLIGERGDPLVPGVLPGQGGT